MNAATDNPMPEKPKIFRGAAAVALLLSAGGAWLVIDSMDVVKDANSLHTHARVMGNAFFQAIKQYETQYGKLPATDGPVQDYGRLIAILSEKTPENPRGIPFLTPTKINPETGRPEFKDPWGNDFKVVLSSSGEIKAGTGGTYETVHNTVAVWSLGPNKTDDHGRYDKQHGKDDICSWR